MIQPPKPLTDDTQEGLDVLLRDVLDKNLRKLRARTVRKILSSGLPARPASLSSVLKGTQGRAQGK
jgi:hypothetical protein